MINSMGGCCQICSYFRCDDSLEFHHIDPSKKEFSFSKLRSSLKSKAVVAEELKKSILLCSNCHKEVHNGITKLPENFAKFDSEIFFK